MNISIVPMFPIYLVTNFTLVLLGYEAATLHTIPHWAILLASAVISSAVAFQWSRTLARSYRREDQTFSAFQRLLDAKQQHTK